MGLRGVRRSRVVTFAAIRLRGPGSPMPPMQGEAIRCRYIKPEYLSYLSASTVKEYLHNDHVAHEF